MPPLQSATPPTTTFPASSASSPSPASTAAARSLLPKPARISPKSAPARTTGFSPPSVGTYSLIIVDKLGKRGTPAGVVEDVAVDPPGRARESDAP